MSRPPWLERKARNVLEEDEPGSVSPHKLEEGEGEAGSGSLAHASSLPGDGEILAWKTAGPEASPSPLPTRSDGASGPTSRLRLPPVELNDITEVRDSRPSLGEDGGGVGVDLGEADGPPSGSLKPHIESADPGEEGGVGESIHAALLACRCRDRRYFSMWRCSKRASPATIV